jgi:hypothetical protein
VLVFSSLLVVATTYALRLKFLLDQYFQSLASPQIAALIQDIRHKRLLTGSDRQLVDSNRNPAIPDSE